MPYPNKERGNYPAIGKAGFTDADAFIKWYLEDGGHTWLYDDDNFKRLIHYRQNLIGDMAPGYNNMYGNKAGSDSIIAVIRKLNEYIRRIGGQYDVLLTEPELTIIQFGGYRFLVPTRFLAIKLYADHRDKSLAEMNRALALGEPTGTQSQSGAMTEMGGLTLSTVNTDMKMQKAKIADAEAQIKAARDEMEHKIEAIRAEARAEMEKIERMKLGLQVTVEELQSKIFLLESAVYSVECYLGDTVDFIQLKEGPAAPVDAPLVVHQKLRYLDEDLPILISIYGFHFEDSEMFEEALKNREDLVEYFCPGDKCMSFVRVSKTGASLGVNQHGMLEEYEMYHGRTVGVLLRNGGNLYFGWTDEAKIMLPDGNVFYTPKVIQIDPEDSSRRPEDVEYPSSRYTNEQIGEMTPEEQKELADKDQITYHQHQRGIEKQKIMAKVFIFSIIQGLLDNTELVKIPEKVILLANPVSSKYLIFSNADGWIEDNRYGSFSDILQRFEKNHKAGDVILSTMRMCDGVYAPYQHRVVHERSRDGSSRTHDCSINDGEFHKMNLIQEREPSAWSRREGPEYYVSLEKEWSQHEARSNFQIHEDEFINMTFLNSEWLHYAILNKKLGQFVIHGKTVSYAHAVRYLKLAYEYLKQRESEELAMIREHIPDLSDKFPVWMVSLSDWKERHGIRRITTYQAKRFAKWLIGQNIKE